MDIPQRTKFLTKKKEEVLETPLAKLNKGTTIDLISPLSVPMSIQSDVGLHDEFQVLGEKLSRDLKAIRVPSTK